MSKVMKPKEYSVWVGGGEVNDYYLPLDKALRIAAQWEDNGYDDVLIMEGEEKKFYSPNHPTFRKGTA